MISIDGRGKPTHVGIRPAGESQDLLEMHMPSGQHISARAREKMPAHLSYTPGVQPKYFVLHLRSISCCH